MGQAGPNYLTPDGHRRLKAEFDTLWTVERPTMVKAVEEAAAHGDRSENAEYIYGKKRLREIDRRIQFLSRRLDAAVIVDPRANTGHVIQFGATVSVTEEDDAGDEHEHVWQLVGEDEFDPKMDRISWRSPVGQSLMGKRAGDVVRVGTPKGERQLTVLTVTYR